MDYKINEYCAYFGYDDRLFILFLRLAHFWQTPVGSLHKTVAQTTEWNRATV